MNLFEHIKSVLEQKEDFCKDGKIFKNKVVEAALKLDPALLSLLLKDERAKKTFFQEVEGLMIFDKVKFQKFVSNKEFLPDSFTAFKNKIGLTANGEYLTEAKEVVLDFPFKDCVLEGGQTKEDQKRQEIFWNQTLAPDEIDRLFEPKALGGFKRFNEFGEIPLEKLSITDNYIIKGNNLIALHSLRKNFKGKVKLIYVDPPFNTGNDSFGYNDSFNHSTWLTFMKNRLEIAKELLTPDGSIVVHLDWNESHYCKVLLDEVFGKEGFRNEIIWCYHGPGSPLMKQFNRKHDSLLWYSKGDKWIFNGNDVRMESEVHVGGFNNEMTSEISASYESKGKIPEDWWLAVEDKDHFIEEMSKIYDESLSINDDDWLKAAVAARIRVDGQKRTGYLTEKPYRLMERIIKALSNQGDIVLDFFGGSGTTGYVCNYLQRQFILIEQLDNTQNILRNRFATIPHVYFELLSVSHLAKAIADINSHSELVNLITTICDIPALQDYKVDFDKFLSSDLNLLSSEDLKKAFFAIIDTNQIYISYSEMESGDFALSKTDLQHTFEFYGLS